VKDIKRAAPARAAHKNTTETIIPNNHGERYGTKNHTHHRDISTILEVILKNGCYDYQKKPSIPGKTIFGAKIINGVDYLVKNHPFYPSGFYIKCISKTSATGGTSHHKFPLNVLNIKAQYDKPTIMCLRGDGWGGSDRWLREQVGGKLLAVFVNAEIRNGMFDNIGGTQ